ncbi:hypothetical protein LUZ60_000050 [Juncus effusus]|nr:hypothetical protein LUZ60_000050 [Juncus effusus]
MVLSYNQEHIYRHPWDRVTAAAWRKYTDPAAGAALSHIADVHTLSRGLDSESGRLVSTRCLTVRSPLLPFPLRRLIGHDSVVCHCVELSTVDASSRSMDVVVKNVSMRSLIEVEEKSTYRPHPDQPAELTLFRQETSIRVKPLSAIASLAERIERRCADKFQKNSTKGREVVERICKYLERESV